MAPPPLLLLCSLSSLSTTARLIHGGDRLLPPLVEVPAAGLPIPTLVKPPDPETLWEWAAEREETAAMDVSWASVWPAAGALATHIVAEPDLVKGKRVIELGAGLGVAGESAR
eukprot:scaffold299920_cov23-Tisochrysis_lutea.AAC.3